MASVRDWTPAKTGKGRQDEAITIISRLMEAGKDDEDTVVDLGKLTKLFNLDFKLTESGEPSVFAVIDDDCVNTILEKLDLRESESVRTHATLCTAAYLQTGGDEAKKQLAHFFHNRMTQPSYDDYIVSFCVEAAIFPMVPDFAAELFLHEGFVSSLVPLVKRKWKSKKVEIACLQMLDAAAMHKACRDVIDKYFFDWLEDLAKQGHGGATDTAVHSLGAGVEDQEGSVTRQNHLQQVQKLAGLLLIKLWIATWTTPKSRNAQQTTSTTQISRITTATVNIDDLSNMFTKMLTDDPEHARIPVEALAYATLQATVREELARDKESLKRLVKALESAPPRSPLTYGALSIFANLTRYQPVESEEQKRLQQLKAYADAAGKAQSTEPLDDDAHVAERCKRVFEAGLVPVLVSHSKTGSVASLSLSISIIHSLSATPSLRGQLAQQGAVRLLIAAWTALPSAKEDEQQDATTATARRTAAHALARILISTNPSLIFRQPIPPTAAVRPLTTLLTPDDSSSSPVRDLLPTFEALLALTNLASTTDADTLATVVRSAWDAVEELLFANNARVATAALELVCNVVQSPEQALTLFGDGSAKAQNRIKLVVALADAEDEKTRSAAGGALASLTGFEAVVKGVVALPRGVEIVLGLCRDEGSEGLRHRGAVVVVNMISQEGEVGEGARERLIDAGGVQALTECAKMSRTGEVVRVVVHALEMLLGGK